MALEKAFFLSTIPWEAILLSHQRSTTRFLTNTKKPSAFKLGKKHGTKEGRTPLENAADGHSVGHSPPQSHRNRSFFSALPFTSAGHSLFFERLQKSSMPFFWKKASCYNGRKGQKEGLYGSFSKGPFLNSYCFTFGGKCICFRNWAEKKWKSVTSPFSFSFLEGFFLLCHSQKTSHFFRKKFLAWLGDLHKKVAPKREQRMATLEKKPHIFGHKM